ncbi:hypothetical protein ACMCE5_001826, partial [Campylobacter jejuni]
QRITPYLKSTACLALFLTILKPFFSRSVAEPSGGLRECSSLSQKVALPHCEVKEATPKLAL